MTVVPELIRLLRVEERRDPVDQAFFALKSLSKDQVDALIAILTKFNKDRPYARRVSVSQELAK
jgi:hypothetical protein